MEKKHLFSLLDGWWAEGYNSKNGWIIGKNAEYESYEMQDDADSLSLYNTLENKIAPLYYEKNENGISDKWVQIMKNSIMSTGGKYSMARMVVEYTEKLYMPLINLTNIYFTDLDKVMEYSEWKKQISHSFDKIKISQNNNMDNITMDAGNNIDVSCTVDLPNIELNNVEVQVYYGKILDNGTVENISIIPMKLEKVISEKDKIYEFKAKIELTTGGDYGYTFRVMPKHEMLLDSANLNLVKWTEKE